jgi:nucleoside-diphosphate-sugar epimerase
LSIINHQSSISNALVTGGGGFLGRYIVEGLLARGVSVRILARGEYPELAKLGVDCRRGNLGNAKDVLDACDGVATVFHVAALAGLWGSKDYYSVNITGTQNIIEACRKLSIPRLIFTSSPSVVFGMESIEHADETLPYPKRYYASYPESKAISEQAVLAANGKDGVATCALRPHLIWGPRDNHIIPMITQRARDGQLVQIGDGTNKVDLTYVTNAADAHLQAADKLSLDSPVAGQAYFISDPEPVNLWQWIGAFLERAELPAVKKQISYSTAYRLGAMLEPIHRLLPFLGEPRVTRFSASQFATHHYFDWSKATRDFGFQPAVDNETGLDRTFEWLKETGAL